MQFMAVMGGFAVFNSTGMLVATIASGFMCTSWFLMIAAGADRNDGTGPAFPRAARDIGAGLTLGLLGGLFIGGFVLLCWAYGFGANNLDMYSSFPYDQNWYFQRLPGRRAERRPRAGVRHARTGAAGPAA